MRAIVMTQHGGPGVLEARELPEPTAASGEVLVRVRAFGLNHADTYMRSGVWSGKSQCVERTAYGGC